jgi:flagellar biosynthesis/type III secretory pathway protein FliH
MTTAPQKYPEQETDNNQQIDVSDILHLVRTANEKGYIKTGDQFTKPKAEFKSRTLKDIAESNMLAAKEKAKIDPPAETPEQPDSLTDNPVNDPVDDQPDAPIDDLVDDQLPDAPDVTDAPETDMPQSDAVQQNPDDNADPLNLDAPETETTQAPDSDGFKSTLAPASKDTAPQDMASADNAAEYDRGVADGKAAAMAEMEANMNSAVARFVAVTDAIAKEESIDLAKLEAAMFGAINQLASERAGMEIDTHPTAFTDKVASMVSRIRNRIEDPVIHLHPDDLVAIQPQLEKQLAPRQISLLADDQMKRGDARVDVGSIGVMDLIDDRSGKPAPASDEPKKQPVAKTKDEPEIKEADDE